MEYMGPKCNNHPTNIHEKEKYYNYEINYIQIVL